jgi:hypothetical protein
VITSEHGFVVDLENEGSHTFGLVVVRGSKEAPA